MMYLRQAWSSSNKLNFTHPIPSDFISSLIWNKPGKHILQHDKVFLKISTQRGWIKNVKRDFPGGPVIKTLSFHLGAMG